MSNKLDPQGRKDGHQDYQDSRSKESRVWCAGANRPLTTAKSKLGKKVGQHIQQTCFDCPHYLNAKGVTPYCYTSFWYTNCHMTLCNMECRREATGRELTCEQEHLQAPENSKLCCRGQVQTKWTGHIEPEDQIDLCPRCLNRNSHLH
jgi:hypothetical protein